MVLVIELSPTVVGSEWIIPSIKGPSHSSPHEWNSEIYYDWNDIIGVGSNNGDVTPNNPSGNSYIFVLKNIKTKNNDNSNATGCLFELGGTYGFVMGTSLEDPSKFKIAVGQYPSDNIAIEVSMSEFDNGNDTHEIVGYLDTSSSNKLSLYIDGIQVGETSGNVSTRFWGTGDGKFGGPNGVSSDNGIVSTDWSETSNEEKLYIYKYNNNNAPIINYRINLGKDGITNEELKNSLSIKSGSGTIVDVTGSGLTRTINTTDANNLILDLSYNINGDLIDREITPLLVEDMETLSSITMENIVGPDTTGTLTITFDQSINETNLNAYVNLEPSYIGTLGDITSADGGITWTGTVTRTLEMNKLDNKIVLDYNGVTGETSYEVLENGSMKLKEWNQVGETIQETGWGVALTEKGDVIALGMGNNTQGGNDLCKIYKNENGTWVQKGEDIESDTSNRLFGWIGGISLSDDGNRLGISSLKERNVLIYDYEGSGWVLKHEIITSTIKPTVYLSGDGNRLLINNYLQLSEANIYENVDGIWSLSANQLENKIVKAASMSKDGNAIVTIGEGDETNIYKKEGDSWVKKGNSIELENEENKSYAYLGISRDGNNIVLSAFADGIIHIY